MTEHNRKDTSDLFEELKKAQERNKDVDPNFWIPAFIQVREQEAYATSAIYYKDKIEEMRLAERKELAEKIGKMIHHANCTGSSAERVLALSDVEKMLE